MKHLICYPEVSNIYVDYNGNRYDFKCGIPKPDKPDTPDKPTKPEKKEEKKEKEYVIEAENASL